jgi:hypothetical protein
MRTKLAFAVILALCLGTPSAKAQWLTQSVSLKAGWNAVYLHVDASHATLQDLIGSGTNVPISEVWRWNTSSTMQFVSDEQTPAFDASQWASWSHSAPDSSLLQRLVGNTAYLVCVNTNVPTYTWNIKGKPVPPSYHWTSAGINFIGFPTVPTGPPTFYDFLMKAPDLYSNAQIFQYTGGDMGAANPAAVSLYAWRTATVKRGQAFWMCKTNYFNTYFGPFEVDLNNAKGVDYANTLSVRSFRLRNLTATNVIVTLNVAASETPPAGQTNIVCVPPLLVRGSLNASNLTYACAGLAPGSPCSWTLKAKGAAGSEVEVVLGLNRSAMTGQVGEFQAGVLSFTDSLGFTKVDVPVSANVASSAGLWVGSAAITRVGEYLKSYAQDATNGLLTVTDTNSANYGAYVVTGTNTQLGSVSRTYPLRLIVHNPASGNPAILLQHVFYGVDAYSNTIVTTSEDALSRSSLKDARRISATHLPWSAANAGWAFSGNLDQTSMVATVTTDYDDSAANPFVHTYHPDHDNLSADGSAKLAQGAESYAIRREIVLSMMPPTDDFDSYVSKSKTLSGDYSETITLLGMAHTAGTDTREFHVRGVFSLNRITDIPTLTPAPVTP